MKNGAFAIRDVNVAHAHCGFVFNVNINPVVFTLVGISFYFLGLFSDFSLDFNPLPHLSSLMLNILTTHVQYVLLVGVLFIATLWSRVLFFSDYICVQMEIFCKMF